MPVWVWIALGVLAVLVIGEELRIYKGRREFRKRTRFSRQSPKTPRT
jgi:hypothetical protein